MTFRIYTHSTTINFDSLKLAVTYAENNDIDYIQRIINNGLDCVEYIKDNGIWYVGFEAFTLADIM